MKQATTSADFFEDKYRQCDDPWNFSTSDYERARYKAIVAALEGQHYRRAFEPGCSVGVLTQMLAHLCDQVSAIDISPTAVQLAKLRCAQQPQVSVVCGSLPEAIPDGRFDLIVFSEIGYYFPEKKLEKLVHSLTSRLAPGGIFLAAHWLGNSSDHLLHGDQVHEVIRKNSDLSLEVEQRSPGFRLDRLGKQ